MRRTTYINKIRRTLLTLCLMVSATMVWAVEVGTEAGLKTALTEGSGSEVTLTADINISETIVLNENRTLTLDLAGHNITATNVRVLWIKNGDITLKSSVNPGKVSVVGTIASNSSVIRVGDSADNSYPASLKVEASVTIETDLCYGITIFGKNNAESLVVDGTINTKVSPAVSGNGSTGLCQTNITIGETAKLTTTDDVALYHPQNGTLTVKGSISGAGGIEMKGGQLIVEGTASISILDGFVPTHPSPNNNGTSTIGYAIAIVENGEYAGVSTVNINPEAEINGPVAVVKDSDKKPDSPEITFDPDGLQMAVQVKDNNDKVVGQYISLELAMKDAPAGSTIMLMDNVEITSTIETSKNYILDLNGKTITSDGQRALWIRRGDVTINSTTAGGKIVVPTIANNDQSVIRVGSNESDAVSLTVGENITISADECYGITVFGTNTTETLTVNGSVNTKIRPAISGNGSVGLSSTNITIGSTANITTTDEVAIYQPQAGTLKIKGDAEKTDAGITGAGGIEIKGGTLIIEANAKIKATDTPTHTPNNDGTSTRGYAIAIVENNSQNGAYGGGEGVKNVTIDNNAKIEGPIAELQDSPRASFNPTYSGAAVGGNGTKVAAIGYDKYFTVEDAIKIVPSTGIVKLLGDLTRNTLVLDQEKTYTLDLAGFDLTGDGHSAIQITHGHVTLDGTTGSKVTVKVTVSGTPTAAIQLGKTDNGENRNVSLTINNNVEVTSDVSTGVLLSGTNTRETLEVKGKITTFGEGHIAIKAEDEVAKIRVASGAKVEANDAIAIYQANTGELVIDGTVTGTDGIKMYGGNLKVNNATITAASATNYAIAIVENNGSSGVGRVNISNEAHITGVIACLVESQNKSVADPLFTGDILMVAETPNSNGFGEKYAKLEDAIAAAISGKEVKLLDDITVTAFVPINKAITLDMDDYSIINNQSSGVAMTINAGANDAVILKNGGITTEKDAAANNGISVSSGVVTLQNMNVNTQGVSLSVSGGSVSADAKSSFSSSADNTLALSAGKLTLGGKVYNTSTGTNKNAIKATSSASLEVQNTVVVSSAGGNGIDWGAGTLTIAGGKIMGAEAVHASAGTVTINGGTFTGTGHALNVAGGTPTVEGGTYICGADDNANGVNNEPITAGNAQHFVSGGYFSQHIAPSLCAEGYMISPNPLNNGLFYLVDKLVINDGTIWTVTTDPNKVETYTINATYTRNSGMGASGTHFGTLCLPFSIKPSATSVIPAEMTFYKVNRIDGNQLYLDKISDEISAGTPVIFHFDTTDPVTSFTIESENATVSTAAPHTENYLVGTYSNTTLEGDREGIYYLNSDAFHHATKSLTVPAFRAYINYPNVSSAPVLNIFIEGETTDMCLPGQEAAEEMIFDLNGNRLDGLQPGMNIVRMKDGRTIKVYVNK